MSSLACLLTQLTTLLHMQERIIQQGDGTTVDRDGVSSDAVDM